MTGTQQELRVSRRVAAPRERVFDAWTSPEVLRRWWAAFEAWETPLAEVDLRPGGRYRLSMRDPESGTTHTVGGEYREIVRPERLVYTWRWEHEADADEPSVVTVEFRDDGGGATEVVITHVGLADDEARGRHEHGWNGVLDTLVRRGLS